MDRVRLCITTIAVALVLAGCTSPWITRDPPLLDLAPTATRSAPATSTFPRGRFSATSLPNMLILTIENDGHFRVFLDGAMLDSGQFSVLGPQASVDSAVCAAHGSKPGAYAWYSDEENVLTFVPVSPDPCPARRQYLAEEYQPHYMFVFNIPDRGVAQEWLW